jgi:hypothetical protein
MTCVAELGTDGWWFLNLGFAWLAFRAENDTTQGASERPAYQGGSH